MLDNCRPHWPWEKWLQFGPTWATSTDKLSSKWTCWFVCVYTYIYVCIYICVYTNMYKCPDMQMFLIRFFICILINICWYIILDNIKGFTLIRRLHPQLGTWANWCLLVTTLLAGEFALIIGSLLCLLHALSKGPINGQGGFKDAESILYRERDKQICRPSHRQTSKTDPPLV